MVISRPLLAIADRHGSLSRWRRSTTHFASTSLAACQSTRTGSDGDELRQVAELQVRLDDEWIVGRRDHLIGRGRRRSSERPQDGEPGERAEDGSAANETV